MKKDTTFLKEGGGHGKKNRNPRICYCSANTVKLCCADNPVVTLEGRAWFPVDDNLEIGNFPRASMRTYLHRQQDLADLRAPGTSTAPYAPLAYVPIKYSVMRP